MQDHVSSKYNYNFNSHTHVEYDCGKNGRRNSIQYFNSHTHVEYDMQACKR